MILSEMMRRVFSGRRHAGPDRPQAAAGTAAKRWSAAAKHVALVLGILLSCAPAAARDWAKEMFDQTSHDFGTVARGAKVEHRFTIENNNEEEIRIESVKSSCGCTSAKVTKQVLKSWEKAEVVVTLDTRAEPGRKDGTITVVFAPPFTAEVQLHLHAFIRGDVVVQPGAAEFGLVGQGAGAVRKLKISYAGRPDWRIVQIESANPHIEAVAVETGRTPSQINYDLTVNLKSDAPPGYIRDQLVLVTNDFVATSARVPVPVEGLVVAPLSAQPSPLMMGLAEAGRPVTRMLVVQGRTPFHVLAVRSSDGRFRCTPPVEAATRHLLAVTFLAAEAAATEGRADAKLRIETDLAGAAVIEVNASVQVVPVKGAAPYARVPRRRQRRLPRGIDEVIFSRAPAALRGEEAGFRGQPSGAARDRPDGRRRRGVAGELGLCGLAAAADHETQQAHADKSGKDPSHQPAPPMLVSKVR